MRILKPLAWSVAIVGLTSAPVFSQSMGGAGGAGGAGAGGLGGGTGAGGTGAGGSSSLGGTPLSTLSTAPTISPPGSTGSTGTSSVSQSNFLGPYFANPYYQGILQNQLSGNNNPGGFGMQLFGTSTGSTGGGQLGFSGTTTGASTGSVSRGMSGGSGRGSSSSSSTSWVVSNPAPISFASVYVPDENATKPTNIAVATKLQATIQGLIARSQYTNRDSIQISAADGGVVTVSGAARNDEEARKIRNMIYTVPGVHAVKDELTYPQTSPMQPKVP